MNDAERIAKVVIGMVESVTPNDMTFTVPDKMWDQFWSIARNPITTSIELRELVTEIGKLAQSEACAQIMERIRKLPK
jgi:hypothetical protein